MVTFAHNNAVQNGPDPKTELAEVNGSLRDEFQLFERIALILQSVLNLCYPKSRIEHRRFISLILGNLYGFFNGLKCSIELSHHEVQGRDRKAIPVDAGDGDGRQVLRELLLLCHRKQIVVVETEQGIEFVLQHRFMKELTVKIWRQVSQ